MKYAIYKNKIGLRAVEYADTKEAIKGLPYIKEECLPVIINRVGGYTSFNLEYEKENGFLEIIEVSENEEPLTREQMYPKNSPDFDCGWINPEGDTFHTGPEGHLASAEVICRELGVSTYQEERYLEEQGWVKVTRSWIDGKHDKRVYAEKFRITKRQADTLFDLGLWEVDYVPCMIDLSEDDW